MDIRLFFEGQFFTGDLALASSDLDKDESLETAVLISLFTDRRATVDNKAERGWWADTYADTTGDETGSKLWLLSREKVMPIVRIRAKEYATEALAWLKEDGLVLDFDVSIESPRPDALTIKVVLLIDKKTTQAFSYDLGGNNAVA